MFEMRDFQTSCHISHLSESEGCEINITFLIFHGGPPLVLREKMAAWTVDDVADILADEDLRGPAEDLKKAGVNGADFLAWGSAAELQADLRVAPFTAKKLIAIRDAYLG